MDGHRRRAGDPQVAAYGPRVEVRVLPGEVQRRPDAQRRQLGQTALAAETGERGDSGRVGTRRVREALLPAAERDRPPPALQPWVQVPARAPEQDRAVRGVEAAGAGDAEGRTGVDTRLVL